ncbi:MAG: response regulator [Alphaproteobacteria bacterium]|nr:response regulator [Alphaproteobacteria bacterium]
MSEPHEAERRAEVLKAIAGLGVAASTEEVLLALSGAGAELLLSGSAMVIDGGVVIHARPHGLVGMHVNGLPEGDGVSAVPDLLIDGASVGPAVALTLHGHQLAWAGFPAVDDTHLELAGPLSELGRMSLEQVERLQRRHQRVTKKLEGSEATILALFGSTTDPVWALDRDLRLTAFNPAFVEMMEQGFDISPRYGDRLDRLPEPHRTRHERLYRRVLDKGEMHIDWTTPDRSRVFAVSLRPIQVGDETVGVAVYARDVTERQRAAALLRRAKDEAEQANRAKSAFLAQMSHEIRTPLNAIVGLTDLVLGTELTAAQRDMLAKVKTSSNALLHLVSGILDFSRIEAGRMEIQFAPIDLASTVEEAVDTLRPAARDKGLAVIVEIAEGFPARVMGDEQRLRQIVVNLVDNAIKYTDAGRVVVSLGVDGDHVVLGVADTGWGIPRAEQARIFERFQRGSDGPRGVAGAGLGLAITLDLVQRMGGEITLRSEVGEGTAFRVVLPLTVVRWQKEEGRIAPHLRRLARALDILVVDDSADNRTVTAALLERAGHRVRAATSGEEAIAAAVDAFDVVLMDVHMPGLDGLETARRLRAAGYTRPIVALTAHATPDVAESCAAAGMDGFLTKPVRGATLEEEVLRYGRAPRFLVIDDSGESQLLLRLWLERAGADVVLAGDRATALAATGPFDGLFVDHELPDTTGPELVDALASQGVVAPVAAISAHAPEILQASWPAGTTLLTKPFTQTAVLDAADALLARATAALRG